MSMNEIDLSTKVRVEDLASALVNGAQLDQTLIDLVRRIDTEVGEWSFTLKLALLIQDMLEEYVEDVGHQELEPTLRQLRRELESIQRSGGS